MGFDELYINKKTDIYAFDNMIQIDDDNFMINNKILNIAKWELKNGIMIYIGEHTLNADSLQKIEKYYV